MALRVDIQPHGLAELDAALGGLPAALIKSWQKTAQRGGRRMVGIIRRETRNQGETTSTATAGRTGALARAYGYKTARDGNAVDLRVGVMKPRADARTLAYAAAHEYGATISPKRGKYLAIPLDAAKTAAGVTRGEPRSFPNTFVVRWGDKLMIVQRVPGSDDLVPLFLLTRGPITIKARPALEPARERVLPEIERDSALAVREEIRRG